MAIIYSMAKEAHDDFEEAYVEKGANFEQGYLDGLTRFDSIDNPSRL